jgi:hypothetical protein
MHTFLQKYLTKALALTGSVLVWTPLAAPLLFSAGKLLRGGYVLFDFLMPAELLPLVLAGGALLLCAAVSLRSRRAWVGFSLGGGLLLLFGSQGLAEVTGLASGRLAPAGWQWILVLSLLLGYDLAVLALGVAGILLIRQAFKRPAAVPVTG